MAQDKVKLNFLYPAAEYLTNWVVYDREFTDLLGYPKSLDHEEDAEDIRKCLSKAAQNYGVARNFKINPDESGKRFDHLRLKLAEANSKPHGDSELYPAVIQFSKSLEDFYRREVISAASKFLWFRYKDPIVIYDGYAYRGLKSLYDVVDKTLFNSSSFWYAGYVEAWRAKFNENRDQIRLACENLHLVKSATAAFSLEDDEIGRLAHCDWFQQRVFDFYLTYLGEPDSRFEP